MSVDGCKSVEDNMTAFFTEAFKNLPPEELEAYHRTIFMQMDSPQAAERVGRLRSEHWMRVR